MSEQERIMNVALLLWGGCFCLTAAFCLSMGNDHNREKRNWLLWMELSAAALLCCDAAAWFVQGTPGEASHLIMVATNFVVYAGLYLVLFLFNHYVGCYLREDGRLCAPKRSRTVDITCAVGIGLVFVSQFSPLFYYIDAQNIYHRSDAFPLSMALLLIGMGTETTMMAQFYQKLTMGRRIAMFGCVVLPLSVAACQVFQDDISLISLSVGASMILLFVVATSAQNRELAVSERTKEQIRQRLEIATVLNSCVGKLNSDTDIDVGINNLLATVNGYFQADRTYVFEIDPDRDVLINTFEYICGQGGKCPDGQSAGGACFGHRGLDAELPAGPFLLYVRSGAGAGPAQLRDAEGAAGVAPAGRAVDERRSHGGLSGGGQPPRALR